MNIELKLETGAMSARIVAADGSETPAVIPVGQPGIVTLAAGEVLAAHAVDGGRFRLLVINRGPDMLDARLLGATGGMTEAYHLQPADGQELWGASVFLDGWGGDTLTLAPMA